MPASCIRHARLLAITLCVGVACAHIPFFEPQAVEGDGPEDWSLEAPFVLPLNASEGWSPELAVSRAIYSLLARDDAYDALAFTVTPDGPPQFPIGLMPLATGRCYLDSFFPALALLGPDSDPRFGNESTLLARLEEVGGNTTLPFKIPEGYGAIPAVQPMLANRTYAAEFRVVLPGGMDVACITHGVDSYAAPGCGNGEVQITWVPGEEEPLQPGEYYVVWWDPFREEGDDQEWPVAITMGVDETATPREARQQAESYATLGRLISAC